MEIAKSVNKNFVVGGDTVTFKLVVFNNDIFPIGDIENNHINIYDVLPKELVFIRGSVKIDNEPYPTIDVSSGVDLGKLLPSQSKTIIFDAEVLPNDEIKTIYNSAIGYYGYRTSEGIINKSMVNSNIIDLSIYDSNITILKKQDKNFVVLGDIVTYTIEIINSGNIDALNVIFKDIIPIGTELIQGSFKINQENINQIDLSQGVNVGEILVGESIFIEYNIKIIFPTASLQLENKCSVKFTYELLSNLYENDKYKVIDTTPSIINLGITNFKQLSLSEYIRIPPQKPKIESINKVAGSTEIIKCHVVETSKVKSTEGQYLSGYKLIVHGVLKLVIEYTASENSQSVHSSSHSIPFSTFIVLPENYKMGSKIEIEGIVEGTHYNKTDCKTIFVDSVILVNAKILSCQY